MTDLTAPYILAVALVAYVVGLALNYVADRAEQKERRVSYRAPVRELPGCMTCRLAAEAGGDWLVKHVLAEHPNRYGATRERAA